MKKFLNLRSVVAIAICLAGLTSCSSLLTVRTQPKKNDITISPEMKELKTTLQTTHSLAVVLRVPNSSDKVTAEQASQNSNLYNRIERNLLKAGFTVRDRGLLENLLKTGQTNYEEIGKTIQTDIIIEIMSLNFGEDNFVYDVVKKKNQKPIRLMYPVNPLVAKLDCKLTIVNKGQMGGVLTLYKTACTEGCDFERANHFMRMKGSTLNSDWTYNLKFPAPIDKLTTVADSYVNTESYYGIIDYLSDVLTDILRGNF